MNKSEKLTNLAPNGYCEFGSKDVEADGEMITLRGWWWRKTPTGEPRGPSYPPTFIGFNYDEAMDYALLNWRI